MESIIEYFVIRANYILVLVPPDYSINFLQLKAMSSTLRNEPSDSELNESSQSKLNSWDGRTNLLSIPTKSGYLIVSYTLNSNFSWLSVEV